MKRMTFVHPHDLPRLADELVAAFPDWIVTRGDGSREARCTISGNSDTVSLEVPHDQNEESVAAVVRAHVRREVSAEALRLDFECLWPEKRWVDLIEGHPSAALILVFLKPGMSDGTRRMIAEILRRLKAKIGTGTTEVLTQTEYDALQALAVSKNLGSLVP